MLYLDYSANTPVDEEVLQSNAEQSYEFLRQACEFKPGTLLYIGGVIDYHF